MPSLPLTCPKCRYDLCDVPGESGICPECGTEFNRAALTKRRHDLVGQALAFVGYGCVALIVANALGVCIASMPRASDGIAGRGESAAEWLRLVPVTFIAVGIGMLGLLAAPTRAQRLAAVWIAGTLWVLTLNESASLAPGGMYPGYSTWLQPQAWAFWGRWFLPFGTWAAMLMSFILLKRAGRLLESEGVYRMASPGLWIASAAVVPVVLVIAHEQYFAMIRVAPPGWQGNLNPRPMPSGAVQHPGLLQSGGLGRALTYFDGLLRTGLWLWISMVALAARGIWIRERVASHRP